MPGVACGNPLEPMLPPMKAVVGPRLRRAGLWASESIDSVVQRLAQAKRGLFVLTAPPGGGKTTALRHAGATLLEEPHILLFDEAMAEDAIANAARGVVLLAAQKVDPNWPVVETFEICPWTDDDQVEYLAKLHRESCALVLGRLAVDEYTTTLEGSPQIMTAVMDRMAAGAADGYDALRKVAAILFPPDAATDQLVLGMLNDAGSETPLIELRPAQQRWWRHHALRNLVVAEWIVREAADGRRPDVLKHPLPPALMPALLRALKRDEQAIRHLHTWVRDQPADFGIALLASVLLAIDPEWRPATGRNLYLRGAMLRSAKWAGLDLTGASLMGADFTAADLSGANLTHCPAAGANFTQANLRAAQLSGGRFNDANFEAAEMTSVVADGVQLVRASMRGANLTSAQLTRADLDQANLSECCLRRAVLDHARMQETVVTDADFRESQFQYARLLKVRMGNAVWTGAIFANASLLECDLEWLELPDADFSGADLTGSLLTGSHIPNGNFTRAILKETGLADVDWPGSALTSANLTRASFHMGSSRSGLVGSTIPCEGSKTGFYVDDFDTQDYMPPEEIRKACLVNADMRHAILNETDFYLVDLRGALCSDQQRDFFKRCGAILVSKEG